MRSLQNWVGFIHDNALCKGKTMRRLLFLYVTISILSSLLLFLIQPIAAKTLLPLLGGVPAVWNTCMVFFQGMLLVGYLYAFLLTRYFSGFWQGVLHASVMVLSLGMLPVLTSTLTPVNGDPIIYVLTTLFATISLPLFILSATSPLIQNWFGHTKHPDAKDPYFLYSASNIGSLLALLSFPFLLEPYLGRLKLSLAWSLLYAGLIALLLMLALRQRQSKQVSYIAMQSPNNKQRLYWLLLSFAPSSLLIAVTQYITTNIASGPLFWIIPLALYLISFIIVFSRKPLISHQWITQQLPFFLVFTLLSFVKPMGFILVAQLMGYFALVMVCNGELAARKPDKAYLTEYYFWLALGGFLGGVFNSLIAPFIFNDVYEYYIAICLCVYLSPSYKPSSGKAILFPLLMMAVLSCAYFLLPMLVKSADNNVWVEAVEIVAITIILTWHQRPALLAINIAIVLVFIQTSKLSNLGEKIWQSRNFFGVSKIFSAENLHVYIDGVTLHGAQVIGDKQNQALTYYRPIFMLSDLLHIEAKQPLQIAIAGLGTGTLSCAFKNDHTTFFEINPTVTAIANNTKYFTYLNTCPPSGGIVMGDARTKLAEIKPQNFDVILVDTFTSDAIPTHLITVDAVQMYLQKLNPQGMLILHISNSHVDLKPLLVAISKQLNLIALEYDHKPFYRLDYASDWVVLTRNQGTANHLQQLLKWQKLTSTKSMAAWTDDYSNILGVIR